MEKTLEEAAELHKSTITDAYNINEDCKQSFIEGAKWQAERMYTKNQMFFFAGFLSGTKERHPERDVEEIFQEWETNLKPFCKS